MTKVDFKDPYFVLDINYHLRNLAKQTGFKWSSNFKQWIVIGDLVAIKSISNLMKMLQKYNSSSNILLTKAAQKEVAKLKSVLNLKVSTEDFKPTKPSMDHQIITSKFIVETKRAAVFNDTGTGKTKAALDALEFLMKKGIVKKPIVIVPNSLKIKWRNEIKKWTKLNPDSIDIINYEFFSRVSENPFTEEYDFVLLDEATYIKNVDAKRTKKIKELFHDALYKVVLTATPYTQNTGDTFSIFEFLDGGVTLGNNYLEFMRTYNRSFDIIPKKTKRKITIYKPTEEKTKLLMQKISGSCVAFQKKDILDIPDEVYDERPLEAPPKLKQIHDKLKQGLLEIEDEEKKVATVKNTIIKCHQVTAGFVMIDETTPKVLSQTTPKLEALKDIIMEEAYGKKILVWRHFIAEEKLIEIFLKGHGIKVLKLNQKTKDPEEVIQKFHEGDGKYVLIASLSAYKFGHDIYADVVVFHSNTFSVETRKQAIDRSVRYGTKHSVMIIDLYYPEMIDAYILKCLKENKNVLNTGIKELKSFLRRET